MASDAELLERWGSGDESAAGELIERHFDAVYRFFSYKTSFDIEDLVQDTFLACVEGRARFRGDSSFRTFLLATARHKLLHHYRKRRDIRDLSSVGESRLVDLEPSASSHIAHRQEERLLLAALRNLTLDHQMVIELYSWEGLSGPQVAEVLEITEAAMRSRLHRARQALREELERLAASEDVLTSTLADLDGWARGLREAKGEPSD